ncbi:MAG TPA: DUF444 family protein, partial [Limnochordia bacterium]|nr:DUF444 family protein [Limnochordia bacterium]
TLDELAAWLFESLKLPALKPKGNTMEADRLQLEGVSRRGPMGRLDKKRTLIETIKSGQLSEETVRYRDVRQRQRPVAQAVVAFVRDISASMDEEKRYWVRTAGFWLLQWVKRAYPRTECVFVVHDASAQEVDEHDFFHIERAGGTVISSGLGLCEKILADRYPAKSWNRYVACFSDGDNFPHDDQPARETALRLAAHCERFAYGETHPGTIQSNFMRALSGPSAPPSVRAALITKRDDISGWLQAVFGTDEHASGPVPARTGEGG